MHEPAGPAFTTLRLDAAVPVDAVSLVESPPVFIVGFPRSGTTLVRSILASHPDLAIPPESHFIPALWVLRKRYEGAGSFDSERFLGDLSVIGRFRDWDLSVELLRPGLEASDVGDLASALRAVFTTYAHHHGKPRWGDKTPGYSMEMPLLAQLFPDARFVHVVRDGRDAALSFTEALPGVKGVGTAAIVWSNRVRGARRDGSSMGSDRYVELRYEDLVTHPEAAARRLCDFVLLDYRPEMLDYQSAALASVPGRERAIHANLAKPPTVGLRDWRTQMPPEMTELFEAIAGRTLTEFGYERAFPLPAARAVAHGVRIHALTAAERAKWHARRRALRVLRPDQPPPARRW